jgi:O-antigen/teichoic acid export membrane protein
VPYRELIQYGLIYYPASLASFFSYRVDGYLIAFLVPDASASLGYYSMAVGLAEMVFLFPRAVWTMFSPHVAGAPREESDRQVAMVSRVTLLVTSVFALLFIPAAAVGIWVLLPAFTPSFAPFLVLLPGVTILSAANVVSGYMRGIGRPGIVSSINVVGLAANIGANLILIPALGIVGAAAASLFSYSLTALVLTVVAAHLSGRPLADFWIIRGSDVRFTIDMSLDLLRRVRDQSPWRAGRPRG